MGGKEEQRFRELISKSVLLLREPLEHKEINATESNNFHQVPWLEIQFLSHQAWWPCSSFTQCVEKPGTTESRISIPMGNLHSTGSPKTIPLLRLPEQPVPIRLTKYLQSCHFPIISCRQNKRRSYFVSKRFTEIKQCTVYATYKLSATCAPHRFMCLNS